MMELDPIFTHVSPLFSLRSATDANTTPASQKWLPTWGKGQEAGMTVSRVRMWQEGKC